MHINKCRKCGAVHLHVEKPGACECGVKDWELFTPFSQYEELLYALIIQGVADYEYSKMHDRPMLTIDCSGVFYDQAPDMLIILERDYDNLVRAIHVCAGDLVLGVVLFCCRSREMRPCSYVYTCFPTQFHPLLNNAGYPRHDVTIGYLSWNQPALIESGLC